jgi:hypothetical protein
VDEVGDSRFVRLLAGDEGYGPDLEKDEVAEDVGIDGGAVSAEDAASSNPDVLSRVRRPGSCEPGPPRWKRARSEEFG